MSGDQQRVWRATGYTFHLFRDCQHIKSKSAIYYDYGRDYAERSGFRLCKACAARARLEKEVLTKRPEVQP